MTGIQSTGTLTNKKAASGEHYTELTGSLTLTGVTANHACTIWTDIPGSPNTMGEQGVVHTEPLIGKTEKQGDAVKIEPVNAEKVFARYWLTDCDIAAANGTYTLKGSLKGTPEGATIKFVHATTTAEETLLTNGTVPAGIAGLATLSARANPTQAYTPISPTTVETPNSVPAGTTAYTCSSSAATKTFKTEHCRASDGAGTAFGHVSIAENTSTEAKIDNEKTNSETNAAASVFLKSTFGGTGVTLTALGAEATGTVVNKKTGSGEHYFEGEGSLTFTGVTANHECTVWTDIPGPPIEMGSQFVVHTEPLISTSQGQGDSVKIAPKTGNVIARFWLTNCNPAVSNGTYSIQGSVKGTTEGATISFSHAAITGTEELLTNGTTPAGFEGKLTLSARANSGQPYTPISTTTVETP